MGTLSMLSTGRHQLVADPRMLLQTLRRGANVRLGSEGTVRGTGEKDHVNAPGSSRDVQAGGPLVVGWGFQTLNAIQ